MSKNTTVWMAHHPGINNDYKLFGDTKADAIDAMQAHLENRHGGLAGGMMANVQLKRLKRDGEAHKRAQGMVQDPHTGCWHKW